MGSAERDAEGGEGRNDNGQRGGGRCGAGREGGE